MQGFINATELNYNIANVSQMAEDLANVLHAKPELTSTNTSLTYLQETLDPTATTTTTSPPDEGAYSVLRSHFIKNLDLAWKNSPKLFGLTCIFGLF